MQVMLKDANNECNAKLTVIKPAAAKIKHRPVRCMRWVNNYNTHDADGGNYSLIERN